MADATARYSMELGAVTVTDNNGKKVFVHHGMAYSDLPYGHMVAIERIMANAMDALVKLGEAQAATLKK